MNKETIKALRGLLIFATLLILGVMHLDKVLEAVFFLLSILKPFIIGGGIAFVMNLPMKFYEERLFSRPGRLSKWKRPICFIMAILSFVLVVWAVCMIIIPQLAETIGVLAVKIPLFLKEMGVLLQKTFDDNPEILEYISKFDTKTWDWNSILTKATAVLSTGLGSMLTSTFNVATGIFGMVFDLVVAIVFAIYLVMQKEVLEGQCRRLMRAYLPAKIHSQTEKVLGLLYKNFANFLSSQCVEAVILGTLFVVAMTLFGFPYAVLIGTLIAVTALVPIVGAFVGCVVGAFLILVDSPIMAVSFVVMFLVIQQLEGNLIYPRVVGSSVGLPAIWVLVAVSVGGSLFGIIGMLVFIPIVSTVYTLLREDVNERNTKK